jgi:hypothetical protein
MPFTAPMQKPSHTQHSPIQQFVEEIAETDRVLRVLLTKMSKLALLAPEGYVVRNGVRIRCCFGPNVLFPGIQVPGRLVQNGVLQLALKQKTGWQERKRYTAV